MAIATKANVVLNSPKGTESAFDRFLASMDWNGCGNYRKECVALLTKLFATDEVVLQKLSLGVPPKKKLQGLSR